jgi:alkylation response protein AidB-like acyl-CoA dehydrogenase
MNFDFSDEQYALRDMARDLFAKESPTSRVRGLWEDKPFERSVWKTMAEAGLTGLTVPEEFGGSAGNEIDLALVYEEAGRAALPEPLLETTGVASPLLASGGSEDLRERWLPLIASGDAIVAVQAPGESFVPFATEADLLIAEIDGTPHAVTSFEATPVSATDRSRPLATVRLDPSGAQALDRDAWEVAFRRGAFGAAAMLNGVAIRLLERTVAYVKDRKQFGRAVGSFQAVKHKLATMHQLIESSRPAAWYAAYSLAHDLPDVAEAVSVAKAAAGETEALCNQEALQSHGGIGFTWEDDLHLWLKRGMTLRAGWGTGAEHRRRLFSVLMES